MEKYQPIIKELDQITEVAGITEFETLTGMALDYFVNEQVDIAVVEVGLGGLLDSTNVVKPLLTGITTIGKDHTEILGETIAEIAYQKRVLLKKKSVVTGNICADALAVIEKVAQEKQSQFSFWQKSIKWNIYILIHNGEVFNFYGEMGKLTKLKFLVGASPRKCGGSYSII